MNNDQYVTTLRGDTAIVSPVTEATDVLPAALNKQTLETWGVRESDYSRIREVANTLDPKVQLSAHTFGRDLGSSSQQVGDDLLSIVKTSELEGAGKNFLRLLQLPRKSTWIAPMQ